MNFHTMLRRGQEHHAAHFGQPQRRFHVQRRKDAFHRQDVRRKSSGEARPPRQVVGGAPRFHLVEEPEAALGGGERQPRVRARHREDRRRHSRAGRRGDP